MLDMNWTALINRYNEYDKGNWQIDKLEIDFFLPD